MEVAAARLAEQADRVLPTLLRNPGDARRTSDLKLVMEVLRRIGPSAFDALLAVWRAKHVSDWEAGRLLTAFDERSADQYAALAADPDFQTSDNGFSGLARLRVDSEAGLTALVGCFARGGRVPYKASDYARLLHDSFRPRLRSLRRDPAAPPGIQRAARTALVAGGGVDALDDRDRTAVERLIRVKILDEIPELPPTTLRGTPREPAHHQRVHGHRGGRTQHRHRTGPLRGHTRDQPDPDQPGHRPAERGAQDPAETAAPTNRLGVRTGVRVVLRSGCRAHGGLPCGGGRTGGDLTTTLGIRRHPRITRRWTAPVALTGDAAPRSR
ncbi:hypothetical protein [Streptomyces sp. NPDC041003]|uniref:hypothetical protein n=1 Tax=Streptomyces sp. NPDC041003 TaxID=3155730 RepID=UPI0033D939CD